MEKSGGLGWTNLIRVDSGWIEEYLLKHGNSMTGKIITRAYSVRFASTEESLLRLVEFMANSTEHFVFSDDEIRECSSNKTISWRESIRYFGDVDPQKDGKCGELLLYLLVEAALNIPMVAHKIKSISDEFRDQVKGSDGVFFGSYNGHDALLLGESKIHQSRGGAIDSALESVNKFHDNSISDQETQNELVVIKETRTRNMTVQQLEFLLKVLNLHSQEYRTTNTVQPILIFYNEKKIAEIEKNCDNASDGERMVSEEFQKLSEQVLSDVVSKIKSDWKNLQKVYLDFFFVPVKSIDYFRDSFYRAIHLTTFKRANRKKKTKKVRKAKKGK